MYPHVANFSLLSICPLKEALIILIVIVNMTFDLENQLSLNVGLKKKLKIEKVFTTYLNCQ